MFEGYPFITSNLWISSYRLDFPSTLILPSTKKEGKLSILSYLARGLFLKMCAKAIVDLKFAVRALKIGGIFYFFSLSVKYMIFGVFG